ncbi:hypothetical protein PAPHI01_2192 [Pancytospora philotis]|nr:hypothetical protein PAPHI01_2192 [Pancytospora philotis]
MSIQTRLVQLLLYSNMAVISVLLQPFLPRLKHAIIGRYRSCAALRPLGHVVFILYCMVFVMFADSVFRVHTAASAVLHYQAQRNFYLSGLTLFLALITRKLCDVISHTVRVEQTNEDALRQHGNSMVFVSKVIEDANVAKHRCEKLEAEVELLKERLDESAATVAEVEHNKQAYLKLKDKYEKLRSAQTGEAKKNK